MVRKINLPEDFVEMLRQYSSSEDSAKMATARLVYEFWEEGKLAITEHLRIPEKQAHRKYIESIAGSVKASVSAMYTHSRIGRNVISRGLHLEHDVFSYGQWESLLRNIEKEKGLVDVDALSKRIEWMYTEADNHSGELPSTRDINDYYKKNGDKTEEQIHWRTIVNKAKKIEKIGHYEDARIMTVVITIINLEKQIEGEQNDSGSTEEMEAGQQLAKARKGEG